MTLLDGRLHCRFTFAGTTYDYHGDGSHHEYKTVKSRTGLSMLQLPAALSVGDVDALLALVWLAKRAAGERPEWLELADELTDPQALLATVEPVDAPTTPAEPAVKAAKPKAAPKAEPAEPAAT